MNDQATTEAAAQTATVYAYIQQRHGRGYLPVTAPLRVTKTTAVATLPDGKQYTFNLRNGQLPQPTDRWATLSERGTNYGSTLYLNVQQVEADIAATAVQDALAKRAQAAKMAIETFMRNRTNGYGRISTDPQVVAKLEAAAAALAEADAQA